MASPWPAEVVIDEGRDWFLSIFYQEDDGTPIPLNGYTAEWCLRENYGKPVLISLTTENGGIVINGSAGQFDIHMTNEQNIFKQGVYVAELVAIAPLGEQYPILKGPIPISPKVVP